MIRRILFILILFVISFLIFNVVEFELLNQEMNKYLQSLIFSTVLILSFYRPILRIKLFYIIFLLIFAAILFYLLNQLYLSNSLASIGIGILFIVLLSYLPQLIKKGYVEDL